MSAQHPARSRSGFAGLRIVPPSIAGDDSEAGDVSIEITVVDGQVSIAWDVESSSVPVLARLGDLVDVVGAACVAVSRDEDVDEFVQVAVDRRVLWREAAERRREEYERTHPWLCACGKRCKTSGGLTNHRKTGDPRCG